MTPEDAMKNYQLSKERIEEIKQIVDSKLQGYDPGTGPIPLAVTVRWKEVNITNKAQAQQIAAEYSGWETNIETTTYKDETPYIQFSYKPN